jgi:hypothetical protein
MDGHPFVASGKSYSPHCHGHRRRRNPTGADRELERPDAPTGAGLALTCALPLEEAQRPVVVALHLGDERADTFAVDPLTQRVDEHRAEPVHLEVVADDDRDLRLAGARAVADRADDAEQLAGPRGVLGHERDVVVAVDLGQVLPVAPGQLGLGRVEAPVARLVGQPRVQAPEGGLVGGGDVADVGLGGRHSCTCNHSARRATT